MTLRGVENAQLVESKGLLRILNFSAPFHFATIVLKRALETNIHTCHSSELELRGEHCPLCA